MKNNTEENQSPSLASLSISQLAQIIRQDWKKVYFGAVPYLSAMSSLDNVSDSYGLDKGSEIVNYFLSNASTWRGPVAKSVKAELNLRLKAKKG